jgi:hypothetical protein
MVQKGSNAPDGAGSIWFKKVQTRLTALVQYGSKRFKRA